MNMEQWQRAGELIELIKITEKGLQALKSIQRRDRLDGKFYEDSVYNLVISEYGDRSERSANISRYLGNEKLLDIIITELERQLKEFKIEFDSL